MKHAPLNSSKEQVLTTAVLAVMHNLQLTQKELSDIIGGSPATISRLVKGSHFLALNSKEGELAILFIRIYKSLDPLVGNDQNAIVWLRNYNQHLGVVPLDAIKKVEGLSIVLQYLDAMRGLA